MKKGLLLITLLALSLVAAGPSFALQQLIWDVGAAGAPAFNVGPLGDDDSLTGVFNQIGFDSQTSTIQYDTDGTPGLSVGDEFLDSGNLRVNGLIAPATIDEEGLNLTYEVTATWNDVTGYVSDLDDTDPTNTHLELFYTGGTINFYLDTNLDAIFANPGGTAPPSGAGGTGFDNGTLIASMTLLEGIGNTFLDFTGSDLGNQGSVELLLQATYLLPGFWLNPDEVDLTTLFPISWHFFTTDMNIDTPNQDLGNPEGALYTAYSNQNGSAELTVIPEPSTMLLLGAGLVGLAFVVRRKRSS